MVRKRKGRVYSPENTFGSSFKEGKPEIARRTRLVGGKTVAGEGGTGVKKRGEGEGRGERYVLPSLWGRVTGLIIKGGGGRVRRSLEA